jgi:phage gpG-like protein
MGRLGRRFYQATGRQRKKNQDLILVLNGYLQSKMFYQASSDELVFGSVKKYAAVQQFGARKGAFGTTRRGAPIPWGDIPARPFLGTNDDDNQHIAGVFMDYIKESFTGG